MRAWISTKGRQCECANGDGGEHTDDRKHANDSERKFQHSEEENEHVEGKDEHSEEVSEHAEETRGKGWRIREQRWWRTHGVIRKHAEERKRGGNTRINQKKIAEGNTVTAASGIRREYVR